MPFITNAYRASLGKREHAQLAATHIRLGWHPETVDTFFVTNVDRQSATYLVGVQGSGKSGQIKNMVAQDIAAGRGVIVIDPHGDLIDDIIAQSSENELRKMYLLDMLDVEYPFGVNPFTIGYSNDPITQAQQVDRIYHIFETQWPEISSQQFLPRFLRASIITLLCNPGSTLLDMYRLLVDDAFRHQLLKNVTDETVQTFWRTQYDELPVATRMQRVGPLIGRLEIVQMGRPIIRNILGQRRTTINFRKAIERREILLIKLPVKTLAQDARLLGTILVSLIHSAIFSFADVPLEQRPGVAFYVDEFQNFATPDFGTFFTEARKYKVMLTIAHQYRNQLQDYLQDSTLTARTAIVFQVTPDDSRELSTLFPSAESSVKPQDIDPHPVAHLLAHGSDNPVVQRFIEYYLQPVKAHRKGNDVEIVNPSFQADHIPFWLLGLKSPDETLEVDEPIQYLDPLLRDVMKTGQSNLPIPYKVALGFSNCGRGFFATLRYWLRKDWLLSHEVTFPPHLVVATLDGSTRWTRAPESGKEQLYHFIYHLRQVMAYLAANPIGKKSTLSTTEVAHMLTQLPRRAAFVRSGNESGVIFTDDTVPMVTPDILQQRIKKVQEQTRQKYCTAKTEIDKAPELINTAETKKSRWEID